MVFFIWSNVVGDYDNIMISHEAYQKIYIRLLWIASRMVTEVVVVDETEPSEKKLVELELEVEVLLEEEELVEVEEKADAPCMFRRYGHCQGPWMVVTTCEPSSTPLNMQAYTLEYA